MSSFESDKFEKITTLYKKVKTNPEAKKKLKKLVEEESEDDVSSETLEKAEEYLGVKFKIKGRTFTWEFTKKGPRGKNKKFNTRHTIPFYNKIIKKISKRISSLRKRVKEKLREKDIIKLSNNQETLGEALFYKSAKEGKIKTEKKQNKKDKKEELEIKKILKINNKISELDSDRENLKKKFKRNFPDRTLPKYTNISKPLKGWKSPSRRLTAYKRSFAKIKKLFNNLTKRKKRKESN